MNQVTLIYPANVTFEKGRFLVQFPDIPHAATDGETREEALIEATDCLSEGLASFIVEGGKPIPVPSPVLDPQIAVLPDPALALKAAIHNALLAQGLRTADLARLLDIGHKEARQLRDPKHATKLPALTAALRALGGNVAVTVSFPEAAGMIGSWFGRSLQQGSIEPGVESLGQPGACNILIVCVNMRIKRARYRAQSYKDHPTA